MKLADLDERCRAIIAHILRSEDNPNGIDPNAELPRPTGHFVMCLQYVRPERVGSILLAERTLNEDRWQGRVGMVLDTGPEAYEKSRFPGGPWVSIGDLVAWPALENAASRLPFGNAILAVLPDDRLVLRGCDPALMVGR